MFGSDNQYGVHPKIMDAIFAANNDIAPSYGSDNLTQKANELIQDFFETKDLDIYFVATGGAANCLSLASLCPNWGAILCHNHAHILLDEGNGPEMITGGARLIGIGNSPKLSPIEIKNALLNHDEAFVHAPQPKVISITNLNENGLLYSPDEIAQFGEISKEYGLYLHCDGARFSNALVTCGAKPKELSWQNGIDALSFGLTKNGAMLAEAVILFGKARQKATPYLRKTSQQLISKHRFLSAQFIAMLEDDLWKQCAQNANNAAQKIAKIFHENGVETIIPVQGNEVFVNLNKEQAARIAKANIGFYPWHALGENAHRFVTSWASDDMQIAELEKALKA